MAFALHQCDIRFDVDGKRAALRLGEILRNNEWRVHPASMPETSRQQQTRDSRAIDSESGGMKLIFFGRFETHGFFAGFSSDASLKKVLLRRVDFLPS
jgi:hypothetical protein